MMYRKGFLAVVLLGLCGPADAAEDAVAVGHTRYPTTLNSKVDGKPVKMVLTGAAMRTRWGLNVYSIGSYVQEKTQLRRPGDLAGAAVPKQLCLSFERAVEGATLSKSFRDSIATNNPAPAFAAELAALSRYMQAHPVQKGSRIWLTSIPGVGLTCQVIGGPEIKIKNTAFANAVWELYVGQKNLGVAIQTGLTSRL